MFHPELWKGMFYENYIETYDRDRFIITKRKGGRFSYENSTHRTNEQRKLGSKIV